MGRLDRVESENKRQCTLHLDSAMCDYIHRRARAMGKTQSRYIADLVEVDMQIDHGEVTDNVVTDRAGAELCGR